MRTSPLFPVAAGMVCGIVADDAVALPAPAYLLLFLAMVGASLLRRGRKAAGPVMVFAAAVCVGGFAHQTVVRAVPTNGIERYVGPSKRLVRLQGRVAGEPRLVTPEEFEFSRWLRASPRTAFLLSLDSIEGMYEAIAVEGRVRVTVEESLPDLRRDEAVEVFGWLAGFEPPRNPGAFDAAAFNRRQGVAAQVRCEHRENVRRMDPSAAPAASPVARFRGGVRDLLIDERTISSPEEADLLEALILGQRSATNRRVDEMFTRAGCTHFLAASGTNVVMVMFLVRLLCPALILGSRGRTWVMLVAVLLYAVLADPRPPILRASVIAVAYCLARLAGRHRACLNWLSASAIVLALVDPPMVFDAGYQLSYGATIGVAYLAPAFRSAAAELREWWYRHVGDALRGEDRRIRREFLLRDSRWWVRGGFRWWQALWRWAAAALAISLGAWVMTAPMVATNFYRIQLWGPLTTILLIPYVTLVMGLGFAKVAATVLWPAVGEAVGQVLSRGDAWLLQLVDWFGWLPGASILVPPPPGWAVLSLYVLLLAIVLRFRPLQPRPAQQANGPVEAAAKGRRFRNGALLGASALALGSSVIWLATLQGRDRLVVTVLSVGAGSAVVMELPDGRTVMYDAGNTGPYDVGRNVVVPFLRQRGIRQIDRLYISHANLDHYSGIPGVMEQVPSGPVVVNEYFARSAPAGSAANQFLKLLGERGHPVQTLDAPPTVWDMGAVRFERMWPPADLPETIPANDTSTVLRVAFQGRSILLPGDIEDLGQRALLERGGLRADVLVLPHHGGMEPSSAAFIRSVGAEVVIRSSHERLAEAVSALEDIAAPGKLLNTADVGAVTITMSARGIEVSTTRRPR